MNISKINNVPQSNFRGQIITKGDWNDDAKQAFLENNKVRTFSKHSTIIGDMKSYPHYTITYRKPFRFEMIYKLNLSIIKDHPSVMDMIKEVFHLNKTSVTRNYHSADGIYTIIKNTDAIKKAFKRIV